MHLLLEAYEEFHLLASVTAEVAGRNWPDEPIDFIHRRILRILRATGPLTVADLARARYVTRQHAWKMTQQLSKAGFVEEKPNPAHKRSMLIDLTPKGVHYTDQHDAKVITFLEGLLRGRMREPGAEEVVQFLRAIRGVFDTWLLQQDVEDHEPLEDVQSHVSI